MNTKPRQLFCEYYGLIILVLLSFGIVASTLAFSNQIAAYSDIPKRTVIQVVSLVVFIIWFARGSIDLSGFILRILIPSCFGAMLTLGLLPGHNSYPAIENWIHWMLALGVYFVVSQIRSPLRASHFLLSALAVGACFALLIGYLHYFQIVDWVPQQGRPVTSTFGNRNWFAQYLIIALPAFAYFTAKSEYRPGQYASSALLALAFAFLLKINSSAAYVSILAQLSALLLLLILGGRLKSTLHWLSKRRGPSLLFFVVFASFTAFGPSGLMNPFPSLAQEASGIKAALLEATPAGDESSSRNTVEDRLKVYRVTSHMIQDNPILGVGLGGFRREFPAYNRDANHPVDLTMGQVQGHAHNDWLQTLAELGPIVPLLLFGWSYFSLRHIFRIVRTKGAEPGKLIAPLLTCSTGLIGIAVFAIFSYPLHNAVPPYLIAILAGLLTGLILAAETSKTSGQRVKRVIPGPLRLPLLGLFIWLLFCLISFRADVWRYEYLQARVAGSLQAGRFQEILAYGQEIEATGLKRTDHLAYLAQAQLAVGMPAEARESTSQLLKQEPHNALAYALRGLSSKSESDHAQAHKDFRVAYELMPTERKFEQLLMQAEKQQATDKVGERIESQNP